LGSACLESTSNQLVVTFNSWNISSMNTVTFESTNVSTVSPLRYVCRLSIFGINGSQPKSFLSLPFYLEDSSDGGDNATTSIDVMDKITPPLNYNNALKDQLATPQTYQRGYRDGYTDGFDRGFDRGAKLLPAPNLKAASNNVPVLNGAIPSMRSTEPTTDSVNTISNKNNYYGLHQSGVSLNGVHSNSVAPNGLHSNGVVPNGLHSNGVVANVVPNGVANVVTNGVVPNGLHSNGLHANGIVPNGFSVANTPINNSNTFYYSSPNNGHTRNTSPQTVPSNVRVNSGSFSASPFPAPVSRRSSVSTSTPNSEPHLNYKREAQSNDTNSQSGRTVSELCKDWFGGDEFARVYDVVSELHSGEQENFVFPLMQKPYVEMPQNPLRRPSIH